MNADRLLEHYERIADAPDAILHLRQLILTLAVRGKLVRQDPRDEPAESLLTQEQRIIKEAEFDSQSEDRPNGWASVIVGQLVKFKKGRKPTSLNTDGRGLPYLDIAALERGKLRQFTDDENCLRATIGDLVVVCDGSRSGLLLEGREGILGSTLATIQFSGFTRDYLRVVFESLYEDLNGAMKGAAIPHLNIPRLLSMRLFLPPLAEQHRIVAKVNELMALCDRLEAARTTRETTRDRLMIASLARLGATDPDTLRNYARFALDALPALTMRPDQIRQLRQTILNLAVRGKLVPQDSNDELASDMLKLIAAENKELMAAKGIRSQKPALPAENFEGDTEIPSTWRHVYLQDIAYQITDGTHLTPKYTEAGKPFLSAQNVKPFRFMPDRHRFVSQTDFDKYRANRRPERGDILMTRVGAGIGEAAVLDSDFEFAFYVSLCLIKVPNRLVSADYLVLWLNSPEGRESSRVRTYGKGASQGNLNLGLIRTFKIPLPPLAEQHRIVAKVDALMALCDRLEASLTATAATRRRLLDALLAEVLAPADARKMEAAE